MKDTTEILRKLRKLMQNLPDTQSTIAAYIVPSDDAHQNEYRQPHDERRSYVSGFSGSAGTAVITNNEALLWTDGRYYQQAEKQMDNNWKLMKDGLPTTPTIGRWLTLNLPENSTIGVDSQLLSFRTWKTIQKDLFNCTLVKVHPNLIDLIWDKEQPLTRSNPVIYLDTKFCGVTVNEKWEIVKKQMAEKNVGSLVVSALDEIAWFLNMRGSDIEFNPVFFAYLIVSHEHINLFIDDVKLTDKFTEHQEKNKVEIQVFKYELVQKHINDLVEKTKQTIWVSPTSSYFLTSLIPKARRHLEITPICIIKAIKNPTEVEGFINCHIRDGLALCQYFEWIERTLQHNGYVDEMTGAAKLEEFRSKQKYFMGLSFETISAFGPTASIIHYKPENDTNSQVTNKNLYLCDSGAQYMDGTTDVTRTVHFGKPTDLQIDTYTRVLKGQLNLASTVFPCKVKGYVLDTLARKYLWDVGLDYAHGTGHGVGHFLNVHEGPMGVGVRIMPDDPGLQENMFISNEPGYYEDGEFGIRIEDIVQIVPATTPYDFKGRGALTFKTITMCPKQTKLINKDLLTEKEIDLLNSYHQEVWDKLSPILRKMDDQPTLAWLRRETQPI